MIARVVAMAAVVAGMLLAAGAVQAVITIDTVPVGNPGNAAELSGAGAGGGGPDRICGAVAYTYDIGKYEVTAGQYTAFLNAVAGVDTYALYSTGMSDTGLGSGITQSGGGTVGNPYTYSVVPAFTNRPVNCVGWGDAARFANWLTNGQPTGSQDLTTTENGSYYVAGAKTNEALMALTRLADAMRVPGKKYYFIPTEDEWYKAAYYNPKTGTYFDYPTSSNKAPGRDMTDVSGNNANYDTGPGPYPIDSGKYTTVAGEFQSSASPYGTFDQGGNVWEWNEAILTTSSSSFRGLRQGGFGDDASLLRAAFRGIAGIPTDEGSDIGFRVSEVPEPATMALLALGGIGVLMRRRSVRG